MGMMNKFLLIIFIFLVSGISAQEAGITVIDERTDQPMLLGRHDRSAFTDSAFSDWFEEEYKYYSLDDSTLNSIKDEMTNVKTTIVMGTWCSDSRREVPHFFKIADYLNYDENNIDMICVDHAKVGIDDEVNGLDIQLVPTFIFYRDGGEIGRIIETPEETLEKDIAKIVK